MTLSADSLNLSSSEHGALCQKLIRASCVKMVKAKEERGGARLAKNMLVLHVLRNARDSHMESLKSQLRSITYSDLEADERRARSASRSRAVAAKLAGRSAARIIVYENDDENKSPVLELAVRDTDATEDPKVPLVFAVEARESDDECDCSSGLSSALDEALRRLAGSPPDRKRSSPPAPAVRSKKRNVPPFYAALRPLTCK